MERKIYITSWKEAVFACAEEDGRIAEIRVCGENRADLLGNIYTGLVSKVKEEIGAAFVEITPDITAFYQLHDLDATVFLKKNGKKPITPGDEILVQVKREPMGTKLPTVTGRIDLPAEELEKLATTAKNRTCRSLVKENIPEYLRLISEYGPFSKEIVTDSPAIYAESETFASTGMPQLLPKLRLYDDRLLPLFKLIRLEKSLEEVHNRRVWLKSGGFLVIDRTEAMTVIDVNSGKAAASGKETRKDLVRRINLEAADEIAFQLRLRNLSGIVLADFINMDTKEELKEVAGHMEQALKADPVEAHVADVTKLQLVEMTRKKIRKPLDEMLKEVLMEE